MPKSKKIIKIAVPLKGQTHHFLWRYSALVVSALNFRSGGQWFEPGLCHLLADFFNFTLVSQIKEVKTDLGLALVDVIVFLLRCTL